MKRLRYPCLVLDHDDTVMDSTAHVHYPAFLLSLAEMRPDHFVTLEDYFRLNFDPGFLPYCEQVLGLTPQEQAREHEIWQTYVDGHVPQVYPGMARIIRTQTALGGYVCISSHSVSHQIRRDYRENDLPQPTLVFGWDRPRELRKPNPYSLDRIMDRLGLGPKDLLMVDDLKPGYDMAAARGVDFAAAGWAYDVQEIRDFMRENSPHYFETPEELEAYLFEDDGTL